MQGKQPNFVHVYNALAFYVPFKAVHILGAI